VHSLTQYPPTVHPWKCRGLMSIILLFLVAFAADSQTVQWSDQFERDGSEMIRTRDVRQLLEYRGDLVLLGELYWPRPTGDPTVETGALAIRQGLPGYILPGGPIFNDFGFDKVLCGIVHEDRLILGGSFSAAGGEPVSNVVAVDPMDSTPIDALDGGLPFRVGALGSHDGDLVAGYELVSTAASPNLLMVHDGSGWTGIPFPDDIVFAGVRALLSWDGLLWVGGMFLEAGESPEEGRAVACWDGAQWSWPNGGLRSDAPALYGRYPDGIQGATCFAVFENQLYVGGSFHAEGAGIWGIAQYTGSDWIGLPTSDADIKDLVVTPYGLVALGRYLHRLEDQSETTQASAWDGERWNPIGGPRPEFVQPEMVARSGLMWEGKLWIADQTSHYHDGVNGQGIVAFDGSDWRLQIDDTGVFGWVHAIHPFDSGVVLAGAFEFANGLHSPMVTHWTGSEFVPMNTGLQAPLTGAGHYQRFDFLEFEDELYLAGSFRMPGMGDQDVARWDGSAWTNVGDGLQHPSNPMAIVLDLVEYQGDLVAVGFFDRSGATETVSIARWDGNAWMPWPVPLHASLYGGEMWNPYIKTACVVGDELWIGGFLLGQGSGEHHGILRWDGANWIPHAFQPTIDVHELIGMGDYALANFGWNANDQQLWRLDYDSATQIVSPPLDGGGDEVGPHALVDGRLHFIINSEVYEYSDGQVLPSQRLQFSAGRLLSAFHVDNSHVYLGGEFSLHADEQDFFGFGVGTRDQTVPVLTVELSTELVESGVRLVCDVPDDVVLDRVEFERRSAESFWRPIASLGPQAPATEYSFVDSDASEGLQFYRAIAVMGGQRIYSNEVEFAQDDPAGVPSASYLVGATPNPFNPSTRVDFVLARSGAVRVEIVGLNGRRVLDEKLGELPAGSQSWSWNGRDGTGSAVASGSYVIRVLAPDRNLVTRVQLIK